MASSDEGRAQLREYWGEYGKERLSGLVGPMNVLAGDLPKISYYRSPLLDRLRADAKTGRLTKSSTIASPQIEPTVKRFVELLPDDPIAVGLNEQVRDARAKGAASKGLTDLENFSGEGAAERYRLLADRYSSVGFSNSGFRCDSQRKSGLIFRRPTSDGLWDFLFVDESLSSVEIGMLSSRFAIVLPRQAVLPGALSLKAAATFSPSDVVPGFAAIEGFDRRSYAQMCLAADATAYLARIIYSRVDRLLVAT
jgi:hypothetical protein